MRFPAIGLSLYRTDDRGGHWISVTLPVPPVPSLPLAIAAAADGVYLDYQQGDVARSTDGGADLVVPQAAGHVGAHRARGPARTSTSCSTGA